MESAARPEPPVSQYLPPNQLYGPPQRPNIPTGLGGPIASPANFGINQYLPPNQQYGPPGAGGGGSGGYGDGSNVSQIFFYNYIKWAWKMMKIVKGIEIIM